MFFLRDKIKGHHPPSCQIIRCTVSAHSSMPLTLGYTSVELELMVMRVVELVQDQTSRERVIQSLASMSSSQIVSATALHHKSFKPGSSSSAAAASAAGSNVRPAVDTLRHANYQHHNGFSATSVCLTGRYVGTSP